MEHQPELDLTFESASSRCPIFIGEGLLDRAGILFSSKPSSIAIITDDNVKRLHAKKLQSELSKFAKTHVVSLAPGERTKTLEVVSEVCSRLNRLGLDRRSGVVALGGGVVGDLAGFAASIFKRGVSFFQIPTTLLAQVDSSIGGKTGVDTAWGKNQLGTFFQPSGILIDTRVLETLSRAELVNGVGEMIKSGVIADAGLFGEMSKIFELKNSVQVDDLKPLVLRTCKVKVDVVQKDPLERGLRMTLNYGHTIGHAIEASSDYTLSHGSCVILGMLAEGWIAKDLGILNERDYERQQETLRRIVEKIPNQIASAKKKIDSRKVYNYARSDKKADAGVLRMSLPEKIGAMHREDNGSYTVPVSKELAIKSLAFLRRELLAKNIA